jgi:hypothetical protein
MGLTQMNLYFNKKSGRQTPADPELGVGTRGGPALAAAIRV